MLHLDNCEELGKGEYWCQFCWRPEQFPISRSCSRQGSGSKTKAVLGGVKRALSDSFSKAFSGKARKSASGSATSSRLASAQQSPSEPRSPGGVAVVAHELQDTQVLPEAPAISYVDLMELPPEDLTVELDSVPLAVELPSTVDRNRPDRRVSALSHNSTNSARHSLVSQPSITRQSCLIICPTAVTTSSLTDGYFCESPTEAAPSEWQPFAFSPNLAGKQGSWDSLATTATSGSSRQLSINTNTTSVVTTESDDGFPWFNQSSTTSFTSFEQELTTPYQPSAAPNSGGGTGFSDIEVVPTSTQSHPTVPGSNPVPLSPPGNILKNASLQRVGLQGYSSFDEMQQHIHPLLHSHNATRWPLEPNPIPDPNALISSVVITELDAGPAQTAAFVMSPGSCQSQWDASLAVSHAATFFNPNLTHLPPFELVSANTHKPTMQRPPGRLQRRTAVRRKASDPLFCSNAECGYHARGPSRTKLVKRHEKTHEKEELAWVCGSAMKDGSECRDTFSRLDNLKKHRERSGHKDDGRELRQLRERKKRPQGRQAGVLG